MYDINLKNVKKGKNLWGLFLGIGIVVLIIMCAVFGYLYMKNKSMDSNVEAFDIEVNSKTNSDDGTMYSPVYHYEVNGTEYVCSSHSSSSFYPNNIDKKVYYKSSNPNECVTGYDKKTSPLFLLLFLIPFVFITVGAIGINKVNKRIKTIKELNQKGKLVKNIPYRTVDSGIRINNRVIFKLMVDYKLPSGSVISLASDPRYDGKVSDNDGTVDLVIDESNPNNYFIDFDINRLSGNRPEDYYQQYNSGHGTIFDNPQNQNINKVF